MTGGTKRSLPRRLATAGALLIGAFYAFVILSLVALRWVTPPTTAVQAERRVQAWFHAPSYRKTYEFVTLDRMSPNLWHAVVAAEDARFFHHGGFDWTEVQIAVKSDLEEGRKRGASTITQQLVKNLFLGTSRSLVRKGVEFSIVPIAELVLPKRRILELYLNVIEWGPGIYGGEAAARHYYRKSARQLTREEAVDLATVLPAPLRRKPGRLTVYGRAVSGRMAQMGW